MRGTFLAAGLLFFASGAAAQSTSTVSVTGFLTDTLCGKRGATGSGS